MMTSFNLKNIDPGSPDLHFVEFIYGPTYLPNVVFLALAIAEIAWGHYLPSSARNFQTLLGAWQDVSAHVVVPSWVNFSPTGAPRVPKYLIKIDSDLSS